MLLYTLLTVLVYLAFLPVLLLLPLRSKYKTSVPARFFLKDNPPFPAGGVWFHACSLGEAKALGPLIEAASPAGANISVITQTGFAQAQKYKAQVRFLPFEPWLFLWARPQKLLVVMEAELWFLLFFIAKRQGARTILVNARISDRSFGRYRRFAWFYKKIFANIDKIFCQSPSDKERLEALGARKVEVTGNIKLAAHYPITRRYIKPQKLVITAGSTHEGEEHLILEAFLKFGRGMLLLVPRHPERFGRVEELVRSFAKKHGMSFDLLSRTDELKSDIIVVDKMGELINLYAISDIVILGGAFVPIGGHNPLEPAYFGCRIITGKNIFNQRETFSKVSNVQFVESDEIFLALKRALEMESSSIKEKIDICGIIEEIARVV